MGFKDILTDNTKILHVKIDGKEIPFRKLTVEQTNMLEKQYPNMNDLVYQKVLCRLQNAELTVTTSDMDRLTEEQYLELIKSMNREIYGANEDFLMPPMKKE